MFKLYPLGLMLPLQFGKNTNGRDAENPGRRRDKRHGPSLLPRRRAVQKRPGAGRTLITCASRSRRGLGLKVSKA